MRYIDSPSASENWRYATKNGVTLTPDNCNIVTDGAGRLVCALRVTVACESLGSIDKIRWHTLCVRNGTVSRIRIFRTNAFFPIRIYEFVDQVLFPPYHKLHTCKWATQFDVHVLDRKRIAAIGRRVDKRHTAREPVQYFGFLCSVWL